MYRASLQEANFVKIWYLSKICFKTEGTAWKNQQNKKAVQNTQPFYNPGFHLSFSRRKLLHFVILWFHLPEK